MQKVRFKPNKYRNVRVRVAGRWFDSKKEANQYLAFLQMKSQGKIRKVDCQPLIIFPCGVTFRPDFKVIDNRGREVYYDVKSPITRQNPAYRIKLKLLSYFFPRTIFREI